MYRQYMPAQTRLHFDHALLPGGWARDVLIEADEDGWITSVNSGAAASGTDMRGGIALPGMPNCHSHAFQRAMAGLAESGNPGDDDFWSWRNVMYGFVGSLTPPDLAAIAAQAYAEMLESGFTAVAEFHYLHHAPDGGRYDDPGEMSAAIAEAGVGTGIGLTFLPVFYANGGFGGIEPGDAQRRFINSAEYFGLLLERVRDIGRAVADAAVGIAPHSLRAVTPESLAEVVALEPSGPIHIHIAEQTREVDDCLAWSGERPVEWLFNHANVDRRWCLVHATHLTRGESDALGTSGAVAGLCPITEANLGDGIFDCVDFMAGGGRLAIGSDSNVLISVAEEIRLLEYSQRLRDRQRNRLNPQGGSTGRALFGALLTGGAQASGRRIGRLENGYRADIVSLDAGHPALVAREGDGWLDGWLFAANTNVVSDVWCGARHVVSGGRHRDAEAIARRYADTLTKLLKP